MNMAWNIHRPRLLEKRPLKRWGFALQFKHHPTVYDPVGLFTHSVQYYAWIGRTSFGWLQFMWEWAKDDLTINPYKRYPLYYEASR